MNKKIREKLRFEKSFIKFIVEADARLLKMLYAVAKEYTQEDFTLPGELLSEEELKNRINHARARIMAGHFNSQEDLEKEMGEW